MEQFGDVHRFIDGMLRENVAPQISRQISRQFHFFSHLNKVISLKLELAALVDVGRYLLRPSTF